MERLFFDFKGDFQWASIAAIVAVFGALASLLFSFLSYHNTKKSILIQKEMDQKKNRCGYNFKIKNALD